MARLIFVNKNPYDVFVPTPNGAGRRVKIGEAVEGDYFIDLANTGMLSRYAGDPANVNIICYYKLSTYLNASESKSKPVALVAPVLTEVVAPVEDAAPVVEEVPVVEAVAAPVESVLSPSDRDLMALSMDELRMVAATMGLDPSPDVKKKTIVKMINSSKK